VETPAHIAELRIVGGHVALDFVNTQDGVPGSPPTFERITSYHDLVAWAQRVGVVSRSAADRLARAARGRRREASAAHRRALELRGALYELFGALARGSQPPPASVEALREAERDALAHARLRFSRGSFTWDWSTEEDLRRIVWPVAHAAVELVTSNHLRRLKACAGCRWLFLDTSRNGRRRWCTMEVCGTHEKMRRYIARRAARRAPERQAP
jgi:predicted RNA-binding Zn ribbon-like protein